MGSSEGDMSPAYDTLFRSYPETLKKALLYEEYYADIVPFRRSLMSASNPFTHIRELSYMRSINADMSPSDDPLFRSNPFTFFKALLCLHNTPHIREL